jgi:hypothetical protein
VQLDQGSDNGTRGGNGRRGHFVVEIEQTHEHFRIGGNGARATNLSLKATRD